MGVKCDFSGYATKAGLRCSDGRTILKDAFKHQDGTTVPMVWQHLHNEPANVLGHAVLENREDGVYAYGVFNQTESGQNAKALVEHGDITSLSIYANNLKEQAKKVIHGAIREVSLVLSGANPGARIDNLAFAHSDGTESIDDTEAIIYTGLEFGHSDESDETIEDVMESFTDEQKAAIHAMIEASQEGSLEHADKTVQDVFDSFSEEQKSVVYFLIGSALEEASSGGSAKQTNIDEEGDNVMKHNVFDKKEDEVVSKTTLTHDQLTEILGDAKRYGSLKESFLAHAADYGLDPIDILFPDAKTVGGQAPQIIKRDDTWVPKFLNGATHTPFSRIKTVTADITADEARAKGYVTASLKKEEIIPLMKRVTTPTTIYKKQKLDRDDMIDITDFDVVTWLRAEMQSMLKEELARAALIGDGRDIADEDKINEQNIRPIALDNDDVYVVRIQLDATTTTDGIIDAIIRSRKDYRGSGNPTMYSATDLITDMLLLKDTTGRRLYGNISEVANVLRVGSMEEVEFMNGATRKVSDTQTNTIVAIIVNPKDYTFGADKGGAIAMFDDFDIDYNQYKYLIETRCSGALTKPKSAIIIEMKPAG